MMYVWGACSAGLCLLGLCDAGGRQTVAERTVTRELPNKLHALEKRPPNSLQESRVDPGCSTGLASLGLGQSSALLQHKLPPTESPPPSTSTPIGSNATSNRLQIDSGPTSDRPRTDPEATLYPFGPRPVRRCTHVRQAAAAGAGAARRWVTQRCSVAHPMANSGQTMEDQNTAFCGEYRQGISHSQGSCPARDPAHICYALEVSRVGRPHEVERWLQGNATVEFQKKRGGAFSSRNTATPHNRSSSVAGRRAGRLAKCWSTVADTCPHRPMSAKVWPTSAP